MAKLLKAFQWSQPGSVSYEMTMRNPKEGTVISPYTELRALNAGVAKLCYQMDSADAVTAARQWITTSGSGTQYRTLRVKKPGSDSVQRR